MMKSGRIETVVLANTTSTPTARMGVVIGMPFVAHVRTCSHGTCARKFLATENRQVNCRSCSASVAKAAREARERQEKALKAAAAKKAREDGLKAEFLANRPLPEGVEASVNGRQVIIKALDGLSITFYKPKAA